ncbi:primosome assembly protein, putative [Babesia caballi]|uniref:Primosome assembly protein, putative n=1 Tax=Babesia caballi TaxID=5871 RepID=A0AAV4LWN1_BABCB|nr:primosome assembly protein, putative [Babesia caballi]
MDWRSVGASFNPAAEEKQQYTPPQKQPFEATNDDRRPPKYTRWQHVVGIAPEDQELVLHKLHETGDRADGRREGDKRTLAIVDSAEPTQRYYVEQNRVKDGDELAQERIKSFKGLSLDPKVTPSLDAWLRYIKAKAVELIAKMQQNRAEVPEWMLKRISEAEELEVAAQNCELLHKLSGIVKRTRQLEWHGIQDSAALAYLFAAILFYKKLLQPEFDDVLDAVKWIKTWSNDYLRIRDLRHELGVNLHQAVSTEPVYWEYLVGVMMQAKVDHGRFIKVVSAFMNHLKSAMGADGAPRARVEQCIVVVLTECVIPRLLASGHYDLAVNLVRHWLAFNLLNDRSCSNFGNRSKHYLLHSLGILHADCGVDKEALMDLCDAVEAYLTESGRGQEVELGYLKPLDYCQVKPLNVVEAPFVAVKLGEKNAEELLFRVLELFGSESVDRLGSRSRWYNFVKAAVVPTNCAKLFRTLLLLHALIARPGAKVLSHLLMHACNSKEIAKKILKLNVNEPELWTSYATLATDVSDAQVVYKESIAVFPSHIPLLVSWLVFCVECAVDDMGEALDALRSKLEAGKEELAGSRGDTGGFDAVLEAMTPSSNCAAVLVWTVANRHNLHDAQYRAEWENAMASLSECDAAFVQRLVYKVVPSRAAQRLAGSVVKMHGNNETIVAMHVAHCLARGNQAAVKQLVAAEAMRPLLSMASKHLECLTACARGASFEGGPVRLMLLCRVEPRGDALRASIEEPMPFKLPSLRILQYALSTQRTCDAIQLVTKGCPYAKALWLILTEHLPASSEVIEGEMRSYGVKRDHVELYHALAVPGDDAAVVAAADSHDRGGAGAKLDGLHGVGVVLQKGGANGVLGKLDEEQGAVVEANHGELHAVVAVDAGHHLVVEGDVNHVAHGAVGVARHVQMPVVAAQHGERVPVVRAELPAGVGVGGGHAGRRPGLGVPDEDGVAGAAEHHGAGVGQPGNPLDAVRRAVLLADWLVAAELASIDQEAAVHATQRQVGTVGRVRAAAHGLGEGAEGVLPRVASACTAWSLARGHPPSWEARSTMKHLSSRDPIATCATAGNLGCTESEMSSDPKSLFQQT